MCYSEEETMDDKLRKKIRTTDQKSWHKMFEVQLFFVRQ